MRKCTKASTGCDTTYAIRYRLMTYSLLFSVLCPSNHIRFTCLFVFLCCRSILLGIIKLTIMISFNAFQSFRSDLIKASGKQKRAQPEAHTQLEATFYGRFVLATFSLCENIACTNDFVLLPEHNPVKWNNRWRGEESGRMGCEYIYQSESRRLMMELGINVLRIPSI